MRLTPDGVLVSLEKYKEVVGRPEMASGEIRCIPGGRKLELMVGLLNLLEPGS